MGLRTFLGLKTPYATRFAHKRKRKRGPRNVFVLCTGRCGSQTFAAACRHITNFTSGHETGVRRVGDRRLFYGPRHIEVDNRLAWHLGRLDRMYGENGYYVHLTRDPELVALSLERRILNPKPGGMALAYHKAVLMGAGSADTLSVARDLVATITENIALFLRGKPHQMAVALETGKADFARFWTWIGAEGDREAALAEFDVVHDTKAPLPLSRETGESPVAVTRPG